MTRRKPTDLHSEWLALLDIDGPFYTPPALTEAFGPAVPKTPKPVREQVLDRVEHATADDYDQRLEWLRWLLTDGLGFDPARNVITFDPDERHTHTFAAHTGPVTLSPWAVAHNPGKPDEPRLLVLAKPGRSIGVDVDGYQPARRHNDDGWPATPVQRATRLCRALGCRLALVTNGAKLTLVTVADGVVGHGTWHTHLFQPEPVHLDSLRALLNANRFYAVDDDETPEALLDTSIVRQQDLTGDLGDQVRRAAELLVGALSRADRRLRRQLFADVPGRQVYEAAVTVLMRIVFLLTAEERDLLPATNPIYQRDYAVGTLRERLEGELRTGRASAQRRSHGWHRLLALSRAVHAGVSHDQLRGLAGYGGRLFDPDRFPFLEGRLPDGTRIDADLVDDLTLYEILQAIQVVDGRSISFRALEVEQIGHVYESLLDHSAVKADTPVVGLIGATRGLEPEVALDELEEARLAGDDQLLDTLEEETGKKRAWLRERLDAPLDDRVERTLRAASGNDADLHERIRPFGNLLRLDLRDLPLVFLPGDTYVTETSAKRDSGTAYTTPALAEEIARHALEPLIYSPGPQDTAEPTEWQLRSSEEILDLKICDPAVGSGAIIVAAVRYLADALVRAWLDEGEIADDDLIAGEASGQLDVTVRARREIVARSIYAVDRDPMAVDMAKLSLWLVTMAKDHPFTFLDHAIKCGDSLLGITDLDQLTWLHLDPKQGRRIHQQTVIPTELATRSDLRAAEQPSLYQVEPEQQSLDYGHYSSTLDRLIDKARTARERLRDVPDTDLHAEPTKSALLADADDAVDRLRVIADAVVAAGLATAHKGPTAYDDALRQIAPYVGQLADSHAPDELRAKARAALQTRTKLWKEEGNPSPEVPRRLLHWPLEFPEVAGQGGLNACIANPPYMGNKYWKANLGPNFQRYWERVTGTKLGKADLIVLFLIRMISALKPGGTVGSLATQSVSEVASKRLMEKRVLNNSVLYRATRAKPWPGRASVVVSQLWLKAGMWKGACILDGIPVERIASDLRPLRESLDPLPLKKRMFAFEGVQNSRGAAFLLNKNHPLVANESANGYIKPYITADDLTSADPRFPRRYVIDLTGLREQDFDSLPPPLLEVIRNEIRPTRTPEQLESYKGLAERWWTFWNTRERQFSVARSYETCVVVPGVAKYLPAFELPSEWVYRNSVIVFAKERVDLQVLLLSTAYDIWLDTFGGTMETRRRMTIASVVNTFPLPGDTERAQLGRAWQDAMLELLSNGWSGSTAVLNAFHSADPASSDLDRLRELQDEIDDAVLSAYGWNDITRDYSHYEFGDRGVRWTMSPRVRRELLDRMLGLNHERHGAEPSGELRQAALSDVAGRTRRPSREET